jgi:hypothetical protein
MIRIARVIGIIVGIFALIALYKHQWMIGLAGLGFAYGIGNCDGKTFFY